MKTEIDVTAWPSMPSTEAWRTELNDLRREQELNSLGDRPHSMSAAKLTRLLELDGYERRLRWAQEIDPSTNGIMVDGAGNWFGHRNYHPTTELRKD